MNFKIKIVRGKEYRYFFVENLWTTHRQSQNESCVQARNNPTACLDDNPRGRILILPRTAIPSVIPNAQLYHLGIQTIHTNNQFDGTKWRYQVFLNYICSYEARLQSPWWIDYKAGLKKSANYKDKLSFDCRPADISFSKVLSSLSAESWLLWANIRLPPFVCRWTQIKMFEQ